MKKRIYSLSAACLVALGLQAASVPHDGEEALVFGYCGDYAASLGSSDTKITEESAAIEIPKEVASTWAGASLVKMYIGYGVSSVDEVTVFITKSLEGEPVYTQQAKMDVQRGWNVVTLDSPYDVTGESFFVGYSTKVNSTSDKPIGIDNIKTTNPYGSFINTYNEWEEIGKYYGSVCLKIALTGDDLPQYSVEASELDLPGLVDLNQQFYARFTIFNDGVKTVNDITVKCYIDGKEISNPVAKLVDGPIVSGEYGPVEISGLTCSALGKDIPVKIEVTEVNGHTEEAYFDNTVSGTISCAEKTFRQEMVVEEFTGTWCGYCPIGLVGMAYMKEKYGHDGFNGIAVHNGDPMMVPSYSSFATTYSKGAYPSALINRKIYFLEPWPEVLEGYYKELTKFPTYAGITLEAEYSVEENVINVSSVTEFSFDEAEAEYAMAYVIVEDNVGPYTQTNSFAGGSSGELEGWSNKPSKVENTYYNEVAQLIDRTYGIVGSIPSDIKANSPYKYETALSCEEVENIGECEVIALLLNTTTGEIVNSTKARISNVEAGVEGIKAESSDNKITVYNLQGVKVMETENPVDLRNLSKGLYIVNGKKVIL